MTTGETLEKDVERIYKLLGAKHTERRKLIESYEVDVYAVFVTGHIEYQVIVECKEYSKSKMVSDSDMRIFITKLILAQKKQISQIGIFVTTSGYSKNALKSANDHNIKCLTLDDLYNQLVNFDDYINTSIDEFGKTEISKYYIQQTACEVEDYSTLLKSEFLRVSHYPVLNYLKDLFYQDKVKRVALLGNFGTGKTSLCFVLLNKLLNEYKNNSKNRIPILISLKEFRSGIDIDQLITTQLQKLPGIDISLHLCKELQELGRFIFILDGLDEMSTKVDRIVINENLRELDKLYTEGDNYYIITCRTHFFQDRISDEFLTDYKVLYLTEWNEDDLKKYLKKRFPSNWRVYLEKINSQLAIKDLARTPIFLDMIIKTLSSITENEEFNIQKLYKTYTNEWIEKQSKRRGSIMSSNQRNKFLLELSSKMYLADSSIIHYTELYNVSKEISGYSDNTRIDYFDTDARTSTFITKDSNGNYGFYHRSFMEYFCAHQICDEINTGFNALLSFKETSIEIFELINFELITEKGIENLKKWSTLFKDASLSKNSVQILLKLNIQINKKVAEHFNIDKDEWTVLQNALESNDADVIAKFLETKKSLILKQTRIILERYNAKNHLIEQTEVYNDLLIRLWQNAAFQKKNISFTSINTEKYIYSILRLIIMEKVRTGKNYDEHYENSFDIKVAKNYSKNYKFEEFDEELDDKNIARVKKIYDELLSIKNVSHREAFLMRYRDGYSIKEIAEIQNINIHALSLILYRIRTKLRSSIK